MLTMLTVKAYYCPLEIQVLLKITNVMYYVIDRLIINVCRFRKNKKAVPSFCYNNYFLFFICISQVREIMLFLEITYYLLFQNTAESIRHVLVNGQQTQLQAASAIKSSEHQQPTVVQNSPVATTNTGNTVPTLPNQLQQAAANESNKQFVVTPDYIQQSMLIYQPSVIVYNPNCVYPQQNNISTKFSKR